MAMRRGSAGRRWTVRGMAFGAVAGAGGAFGQRLWDDPAFMLYREAVEAMDRREHARAAALARGAIGQYPVRDRQERTVEVTAAQEQPA